MSTSRLPSRPTERIVPLQAWLRNMSVRPTTAVHWRIEPLGGRIVRFDLESIGQSVDGLLHGEPPGAVAELAARLDHAWNTFGLRGAAHMYGYWSRDSEEEEEAAGPGGLGLEVWRATDPLLVLNVLGRTRGRVLLVRAPLALEAGFLARRMASDDPRLAALVRTTGYREEMTQMREASV